MKRRVGVVVGGAVVLCALMLWRWHGASSSAAHREVPGDRAASASPAPAGRAAHVDPRTLQRGSIAGTIRDEAKAPIAHARVCLDVSSPDLPRELTRDPTCNETDDAGAYHFEKLVAASYVVSAGGRPYLPALWQDPADRNQHGFDLAAGEHRTGIDLTLYKGGVLVTGTVSDISGGPVAHAQLRAGSGRWNPGARSPVVETDDKGAYEIWVHPGQIAITASADGYAPNTASGRAPGAIDVLLTPESSLAGVVIDAQTNRPVEGARVSVGTNDFGWENETESTRSDAEGKFKVSRLTPGRYVATVHSDRGYGRTEGSTLVGLGQQVEGVTVKLFAAVRIEGQVMIAGATPKVCKEASIWLRDDANNRWLGGQTEPDGTIHVDGVLPGTYAVNAYCRDYLAQEAYPKLTVATKDILGQVWEVTEGATIRGKVTTKSGVAVDDAPISARSVGGAARAKQGWSADRTAHDGTYEMKGVRPGSYKLDVETDRGIAPRDGYKVDVAAGATLERDLVLEDGGTIKGTVIDTEGKPVVDVTVDARSMDSEWWGGTGAKTDASGAFTIDPLRPGDYRVVATRGWTALRKPGTTDDTKQGEKVKLKATQTIIVELHVESQGGKIRGSVVDPEGKPVPDAYISAARESDAAGSNTANTVQATRGWGWGDSDKPVLTSVDGAFTIANLEKGVYTLRAYRKGGGEAVAEHVATGATAKLQIKHTGQLDGTARRDGGAPPDEISVSVADLKSGFQRTEKFFRTGGHFVVDDLPQGHFFLTVEGDGGQKKIELDLAEGEHKSGVDVVLDALVTLTGRVIDTVTKQPIAGIQVWAQPAQGGSQMISWGGDDRDHISDETGHFTVKRVPRTQVAIQGFPKDWKESDYAWFRRIRTITERGTIDLGDIQMVKKRVKQGDPVGDLGIHFVEQPADTPPEKEEWKVSWIDPAGPAAKTELEVGDIVVSCDGAEITGESSANGWLLMQAPPGTKLTLGLARGITVSVVLAQP